MAPVFRIPPGEKDGSGSRHPIAVGGVNHLRGGNRDRAFPRRTPPEIIGVHILEIIKCIYEIPVSTLGCRLTRPGVGHGKGIHLCVPGGQRIDIGSHPALPQRNRAAVITGVRVVVRAPVLQFVNLETAPVRLQRLIPVIILVGNLQRLRPIAQCRPRCFHLPHAAVGWHYHRRGAEYGQ